MENRSNTVEILSRRLSLREYLLSLLLRALPIKHGKHRILDRIAPNIWDKSGKQIMLSINKCNVIVDPYDLVGWHFAMLRSFDPEVVEILDRACDTNSKEVFWDIGANKGACFCCMASKLPLLQIVAIEPQVSLSATNIINLESLCPNRYEYVKAGISDKEAELTLVIPGSNLGRASLHIQRSGHNDKSEVIKIQTASQIANNSRFGWPTVVKVDVEGHEPQVFQSLAPCIASRTCKIIVFENHTSEAKAFDMIKSITEPNGYDIFGIQKSPWSTTLIPTKQQLLKVTDYAVIRRDFVKANKKISRIIKR